MEILTMATGRPRVTLKPAGIAALMSSPTMVAAMGTIGGWIQTEAKEIAPTDEHDYENGIHVSTGIENGVAAANVNATDYKSKWIEFGTGEPAPTPAFQPMRRASDRFR